MTSFDHGGLDETRAYYDEFSRSYERHRRPNRAGGYHALAQFLGNVGSLPRIVAPVTFQLIPMSGPGAARGAVTGRGQPLNATVTMQTYVAHAAPPAPPARTRVAAATGSRGGEVAR